MAQGAEGWELLSMLEEALSAGIMRFDTCARGVAAPTPSVLLAALAAAGEEQGGSSAQGGKGRKGKQGRQSKGGRRRKGGAGGAGSGSGSESEYSEYEGSDGEVRTRRSKRQAERRDKDGKGQADRRDGKQPGQKAKKRSKAEVRSTFACCCSVRAGCLEASAQPERALLAAFCS